MLAVILTAMTSAESIHAVTGYSSIAWVDHLDFVDINGSGTPIKCVYTMEKDGSFLVSSYGFRQEGVKTGDTIYIRDWSYTCNGLTYFGVIYKGRLFYLNKKYINESNLITVTEPKHAGKKKVVKTAVTGNVSEPNNWFYIYSKPDDSAPVNCYGILPVGETLEILKQDYNSEWTQIRWKDRICYIRKENIIRADSYLAGAGRGCQLNIKLAREAKLADKGILKNYDKKLTEKEFYKLAANWCRLTGRKQFKPNKKVTNNVLSTDAYNELLQKMVRKVKAGDLVYETAKVSSWDYSEVPRDIAISQFYRAYQVACDKDYLITGKDFTISPADNKDLCLDVWDTQKEPVYLSERSGGNDQNFYLNCNNGFWRLRSSRSNYTITGTTKEVYQDFAGYDNQKLSFEYHDDGTVSVKNNDGLYLDIQGGKAVLHAHLMFAPKSDSSTQKFVFTYNQK